MSGKSLSFQWENPSISGGKIPQFPVPGLSDRKVCVSTILTIRPNRLKKYLTFTSTILFCDLCQILSIALKNILAIAFFIIAFST